MVKALGHDGALLLQTRVVVVGNSIPPWLAAVSSWSSTPGFSVTSSRWAARLYRCFRIPGRQTATAEAGTPGSRKRHDS